MKAALALFSRKGFEETSVEEICLAAGYSKGGFYFHFSGKDDLLAQILDGAADFADGRRSGPLAAELWAQAGRNESVRGHLSSRYETRRRSLLPETLAAGETRTNASRFVDLLLLLEAGLRVQQQFAPSSADEAQDLVDSLFAALVKPSMQRTRRAAGAGR